MKEAEVNTHELFLTIDEEIARRFTRYNLRRRSGEVIRFRFEVMIKVLTGLTEKTVESVKRKCHRDVNSRRSAFTSRPSPLILLLNQEIFGAEREFGPLQRFR